MDVEPQRALERRLGDEQPVRAHDHRVGGELGAVVRDRDAEPFRRLLRRRGREPAPPAARRVRPRQQLHDVVRRSQPLEHVGAERRGRRNGKLH